LARLYDEGVNNVQGLAHADVVELMLQTRIPVPRILDWVDQAILSLHAGPTTRAGGAKGGDSHASADARKNDKPDSAARATAGAADRETTLANTGSTPPPICLTRTTLPRRKTPPRTATGWGRF
jgi:hypothetical protein